MQYIDNYESPIGGITIASDGKALTGLWFDEQKYFADSLPEEHEKKSLPIFKQTKEWLDRYFKGENPGETPAIRLIGTPFRLAVWKILRKIPYGKTITYNDIAKAIAKQKGISKMSAQAVGGAVGHNPISIIVPCHRVIGSNGSLTGYAGGISKKIGLLNFEHADMTGLFVPKKGTAL